MVESLGNLFVSLALIINSIGLFYVVFNPDKTSGSFGLESRLIAYRAFPTQRLSSNSGTDYPTFIKLLFVSAVDGSYVLSLTAKFN